MVKLLMRRQRLVLAEQDAEELKSRNMPPYYSQTHRHRGREYQANGTPQPSPEHCRNDQCNRRHACMRSVNPWLDKVRHDYFQNNEEGNRDERCEPAG